MSVDGTLVAIERSWVSALCSFRAPHFDPLRSLAPLGPRMIFPPLGDLFISANNTSPAIPTLCGIPQYLGAQHQLGAAVT